jgi:hypothetical protein
MAWGRVHIAQVIGENRELLEHAAALGAVIGRRLDEDQRALVDLVGPSLSYAAAIVAQEDINERVLQLVVDQARVAKTLMSERNGG